MKFLIQLTTAFLLVNTIFIFSINAQKTLFSIDGEPFEVDQFEYLYAKNNQNDPNLYSKASVDEYLDLFINLKLKVKQAELLGLDKTPSFTKELAQYRSQIAQTYLVDRNVTDDLVREAYERSKKEIKCAHILVSCAPDATPADSLLAFKKAKQLRERIIKGEDFFKLAKAESDDPSALQNDGKLGFSTVFRFIYPFETAMYETAIGETSQPVRTKYGYHIIKVIEERPSKGQVNVSQIQINVPIYGKAAMKQDIKAKADSIYNLVKTEKYTFEKAAIEFSDDSATNRRGGNLGWLNAGKRGAKFDDLIFEMNKNDISEPMRIGKAWYIFKLNDKKEIGTYEVMREEIRSKVERNSRSQLAKEVFVDKLKKSYKFKESESLSKPKAAFFNETLLLGKWVKGTNQNWDETLFLAEGKNYTIGQFADFIMQNQEKERISQFEAVVEKYYNNFVAEELTKIEDKNLEDKHPDFARLMQEFYDGILMFELTSQEVFQKSVADTLGQKQFYEANKANYQWKERLVAKKFRCSNPTVAKEARNLLKKQDDDAVYAALNKNGKINIRLVKDAKFEKGDDEIIDAIEWEPGVSRIIEHRDKKFYMVKSSKVLPPMNKSFEEAKSEVINDFQNKLSDDMITELRTKYSVEMNKKVLKKLYKRGK